MTISLSPSLNPLARTPLLLLLLLLLLLFLFPATSQVLPMPDLELNPLPPNTWSRVKYKTRSINDYPCPIPAPRHGHSLLLRPSEKTLYLFGGQQGNGKFLNDLWKFYFSGSADGCNWQLLVRSQTLKEQFLSRDSYPTTPNRRGVVPGIPAARFGHLALLVNVTLENLLVTDAMAIHGGYGVNATEFFTDLWIYDFSGNRWIMLYGEWYNSQGVVSPMLDYAIFGETLPLKRMRHSGVAFNDRLYLFGGHSVNDGSCCGYDCGFDARMQPLPNVVAPNCGYLNDLWSTNMLRYEPFPAILQVNKQTFMSSTQGNGVSLLAADGNTDGTVCDCPENKAARSEMEMSPWWMINLGGVNYIDSITVWGVEGVNSERLSNFYVLMSNAPFVTLDLQDVLLDGQVWKQHVPYMTGRSTTIFPKQNAQYVRLQLAGTNTLLLAEVEIRGFPPIQSWQHLEGPRKWTQILNGSEVDPPPLGRSQAMPRGRMGSPMTLIGSKAYLFGGYVKEGSRYLRDYWMLDLGINPPLWSEKMVMADTDPSTGRFILPPARYGHAVSLYEKEQAIIIFGGQRGWQSIPLDEPTATSRFSFRSGYMNDVWVWFADTNNMDRILYETQNPAQVISRRQDARTIVWGDYLFVFGGLMDQTDDKYNMCPDGGACNDMWVLQIAGQDSCPNSCNNKGKCILAKCVCDDRFWGPSCDLLQCPQSYCYFDYVLRKQICTHCCGGLQQCPDATSKNPHPRGECIGSSPWMGAGSNIPTGKCECKNGWSGENCGEIACPCADSFKNVDGICKVNCSGHGTCKAGGVCDCDRAPGKPQFGGSDCNTVFCINNCSNSPRKEGDSRLFDRGECVVKRIPDLENIGKELIEATCICGDIFSGDDCSEEAWERIVKEKLEKVAAHAAPRHHAAAMEVVVVAVILVMLS